MTEYNEHAEQAAEQGKWFHDQYNAYFRKFPDEGGMKVIIDWAKRKNKMILEAVLRELSQKDRRNPPAFGLLIRVYDRYESKIDRTEAVARGEYCDLCKINGTVHTVVGGKSLKDEDLKNLVEPRYYPHLFVNTVPCRCRWGEKANLEMGPVDEITAKRKPMFTDAQRTKIHSTCKIFRLPCEASAFLLKCKALNPAVPKKTAKDFSAMMEEE